MAIMLLKNMEKTKNEIQKKKKKAIDQYEQMEFKKEGKNYVMSYNALEHAINVVDYPFDKTKRGFERPHLPTWKMEKKILSDLS